MVKLQIKEDNFKLKILLYLLIYMRLLRKNIILNTNGIKLYVIKKEYL